MRKKLEITEKELTRFAGYLRREVSLSVVNKK